MAFSHRPVRRAQLISPFGVGAMVDFPKDEALMTAGLEAWPYALEECPDEWKVTEERLQYRLGVTHFRLPPDFRNRDVDQRYVRQHIPYVRFPRWHYCPDPKCGRMEKRALFGAGSARCRDKKHKDLPDQRKPKLIPVRFVAVCPHGHIEDFPFFKWVHAGQQGPSPSDHTLYYRAGHSAALSGIKIVCSCGKNRTLAGVFAYNTADGGPLRRVGYDCKGIQPWLGVDGDETVDCGAPLRVVQRGASNVYFAKTFSSIYLPLWAENSNAKVVKTLEDPKVWGILTSGLDEGKFVSMDRCQIVAAMRGVDAEELQKVAQKKLEGQEEGVAATEEQYRYSEYEAFRAERGGPQTDLFVEGKNISHYAEWTWKYFERICLVKKLRETRVLAGFTRLLPHGVDDTPVSGLQPVSRTTEVDWLPAMVVRGEGIFVELKKEAVDEWAKRPSVVNRVKQLADSVNAARLSRGLPHEPVDAKLLLIHTFAHLLIRQLSYDCGYGSASLRERLYCNLEDENNDMYGVLIYTAAGDSEGTMGGLVRMGEPGNLENTLHRAIRSAMWCSSDPVCMESRGQGADNANLAACHACALLPETSCEKGNRLLDRGLLKSGMSGGETGYFD